VVHGRPAEHTVRDLEIPEVSNVGVELDRKLAALVQALDVDVPEALLKSRPVLPARTRRRTRGCAPKSVDPAARSHRLGVCAV